jgi:hypothetical protein
VPQVAQKGMAFPVQILPIQSKPDGGRRTSGVRRQPPTSAMPLFGELLTR